MISHPDIPTITIHPLAPETGASLRFDLLPALNPPPQIAAAIDQLWAELRRNNPRLHDGPILLTDSRATDLPARATDLPALRHVGAVHPTPTPFVARRATYKTLATAADVMLDVRALGVQALLTARDKSGTEHLLLGRRGSETRIYQGLWENAPSGTLTPPPPDDSSISLSHFTQTLLNEGLEELSLNLSAATISPIALLDDAEARSLDVVLQLQLHNPINPLATPCPTNDATRWEYAATAWVLTAQLPAWAGEHVHAISPPTRALIRWFTPT